MARYQVVTPWNPGVKVNDVITTDNLHPFMRQHVVLLADGVEERAQVADPVKKAEKDEGPDIAAIQAARDALPDPLPQAMINKLMAEALKEDAKRSAE